MVSKLKCMLLSMAFIAPAYASNTACIESVAFYEANTEGFEAMLAVATVVMNRAGHDYNKACKVVNRQAQFSWVGKKAIKQFDRAKPVAQLVKSGFVHPKFKNATHFHDTSINPAWASKMVYVGRVKRLKFYAESE